MHKATAPEAGAVAQPFRKRAKSAPYDNEKRAVVLPHAARRVKVWL